MVSYTPLICPLFVPANRPDRFIKAAATKADAIIVDLEDAVQEGDKAAARQALIEETRSLDKRIIVRVNAATTSWFEHDVKAAVHSNATAIMLAKAEGPEQIQAVTQIAGKEIPVLALIESAKGIAHLSEICDHPSTHQLAFGSIDYALDINASENRDALLHARAQIVFQSRLAQLASPLDGVTVNLSNEELINSDCTYAKRLGFGGKLVIHPKQIEMVQSCFYPSDEEIEWAQRIAVKADEMQNAAFQLDGKMVDMPVILRAKRVLELATSKP